MHSSLFACFPVSKRVSTSDVETKLEEESFDGTFENLLRMELDTFKQQSRTSERSEETCGHICF